VNDEMNRGRRIGRSPRLEKLEQLLAGAVVGEGAVGRRDGLNVPTHKVADVQEAIVARGASVLHRPPYPPDFNPIEKSFTKIKSILERIAARSVDALQTDVGEALQSFTPRECMNYFASSGYDAV
jgi:transposase